VVHSHAIEDANDVGEDQYAHAGRTASRGSCKLDQQARAEPTSSPRPVDAAQSPPNGQCPPRPAGKPTVTRARPRPRRAGGGSRAGAPAPTKVVPRNLPSLSIVLKGVFCCRKETVCDSRHCSAARCARRRPRPTTAPTSSFCVPGWPARSKRAVSCCCRSACARCAGSRRLFTRKWQASAGRNCACRSSSRWNHGSVAVATKSTGRP
jgi:hypothetical protein